MNGEYIMDTAPDNYSSGWERCIKTNLFDMGDVLDIYERGYISKDERDWAVGYLQDERRYNQW